MIHFNDFDISDNARYLEYLKQCIQIQSDMSPLTLLSYKDKFQVQRGYASNLCWHKFVMNGAEYWATPAGDWDEINWCAVFNEHVPPGTKFAFVPEYLVKLWQRELGAAVEVKDYRDNWDYILHIDSMEKLSGKHLKAFRQGRNTFEKNYKYTIEEITPKIDELRTFQAAAEENLQGRVTCTDDALIDDKAFQFALEHWDDFGTLFGFVVRVDGKIVAYFVDELIDETYSIGLFAKADYKFHGVNQFSYWYDAKMNSERGILTQNIMDDVGEKNLRFFKEHLYPLVMLKKFFVNYNPTAAAQAPKVYLTIATERDGDNLTLKLSGKFNTDSASFATSKIMPTIDGVNKVTFDLDELIYISSSGLKVLIAAMKKINAQGGMMTVRNAKNQVRDVLDMTGFSQIFNLED